jgi:hypothetical protein
LFVTGLIVALIDMLIPVFIGRLVSMMEATDRVVALRDGISVVGRQVEAGTEAGRASNERVERWFPPAKKAGTDRCSLPHRHF